MAKLKAYTDRFGLVTSKEIRDEYHLIEALSELCIHTVVGKVYLTNGKQSREVLFSQTPSSARPIFYTRSDGATVRTLSIHPKFYPMTAHYTDGSTSVIF